MPAFDDFTVDVGVLMSGAGLGALKYADTSRQLMVTMEACPRARLVIDDEGLIRHQYDDKLRDYGELWVRRMADLDKVVQVRRRRLDRGTTTALKEAHFDPEDHKYYVRTAAAASRRGLVTHDPDYSTKVRRVLKKRLEVMVLSAEQGCDFC